MTAINIAAVERDTGLPKDTLRVWERRYGFPKPGRDQFGERLYPEEQVAKLRILKRLLDHGHRPSKIIHHSAENLLAVLNNIADSNRSLSRAQADPQLSAYLELIKTHQVEEFRRALSQTLLEVGLARFVSDVVAPLNSMVGSAWSCGNLQIFEEHLYTESLQVILRNAINTIPRPTSQPRILLTTFPQEPHGLGILMAEALFALDGSRCVSLGIQTPISDIANAARAQQADIVALSFSAIMSTTQVLEGLEQLRSRLPDGVEIWAGGACPALKHKALQNVTVLSALGDIRSALTDWRERQSRGEAA